MLKKIFMISFLVSAMALAGCGGDGTDSPADNGGDDADNGAAVDSGTVGENSATFSSDEISGDGFEATYVEGVKHKMQTNGKEYNSILIQMANYDRGDMSYHPNPKEDGQTRLTIGFSTPSGEEVKVGDYDIDGAMAEDFRLSIGIESMVDGEVKSIGLMNGEGTGEITQVDDSTISGTIDLKDSNGTTIKASFSTEYTASLY